ncbi:gibberellin-regulated protein 2-like [Melia azedarach]|uniref:Gibberellin-regulated protein 2-like n=1 Tax=Melia azedarach TaxID=155640 RepID=A0ACC1WT28_MELAZ|nr:gibberellin-regulated protein 2-like [Melia azedarach]
MAISNILMVSFLFMFSLVILQLVESDDQMIIKNVAETPVGLQKIDCVEACAARCQLSSRQRLCKRACGTCCARCDCVPPGTSGNYDACPCYANMTTHGGRHKCP